VVLALLGEPPDDTLDPALRAAVAEIAVRWAVETGIAFVSDRVAAAPEGARVFAEPEPERVAGALGEALAGHAGPVLLVGPDVPRLDAALAAAALADVTGDSVFSFAPATDGKPFLLALSSASPEALALVGSRDRTREEVFAQAMALGGEVGMLRSERRLVTPADAASVALDPIVPAPLRELASRAHPRG
jgi:hypothetical protein